MKRIYPPILLVALVLHAGCTTNDNLRVSLDHGLVLESVNPGRVSRIEPLERVPASANSIRPVATTLDRSGWEPRRVISPAGGVNNLPSYTHQWMPAYTDREAGLSPTLFSALDRGDAGLEMGFAEGLGTLAISLFDAIALVPRELFVDPIWEMNESPEWGYERRAMRPWIPLAVAPGVGEESVGRWVIDDRVPGRIDRIVPKADPVQDLEDGEAEVEPAAGDQEDADAEGADAEVEDEGSAGSVPAVEGDDGDGVNPPEEDEATDDGDGTR